MFLQDFVLRDTCIYFFTSLNIMYGLILGWLSGKGSACSAGDCLLSRRSGCNSWVGKIPWRRKWQPTPVSLPGKSHRQGSLVGYSPLYCKDWTCLSNWTTTIKHMLNDVNRLIQERLILAPDCTILTGVHYSVTPPYSLHDFHSEGRQSRMCPF